MSTTDSNVEGLARVYGDALFELARDRGEADALLEELGDLIACLDREPAFESLLTRPEVDATRRAALIEKVFRGRAADTLVNALQVIHRKGRLSIIRRIAEAYRAAHEAAHNEVDVHVTTAVPLTDALREALRKAAARYAGKSAKLVESVDEGILGGLTVRVGDTQLDSSLAGHLKRIRTMLEDRGMRAIHGDNEDAFIDGDVA